MFRNLFLVKQWHVPYFLYHLFAFHNSFSARSEWIICTCLHIKPLHIYLFECEPFTCIIMFTEQELSFRIIANSPIHLLWKCEYEICEYYILVFIFLQKRSYKACRRLIHPKTSRCRNPSDTKKCSSSKTYRAENVLEVIAISYKTKLRINITCIRMCFL